MYWQPFTGSLANRVADLETNQATLEAEIAALEAGQLDVYTAHAQGAVAPFAIAAATAIRINVPALVPGDIFPPDIGLWVLSGGVLSYDGSLAGLYEVHCPGSFSTSVAAVTAYTLEVVEGLNLATSPVRRDVVSYVIEKQLTISDTTLNPTGYLRLQETGGQIALFMSHNHGSAATIEFTTLSLVLQRSRLP